MIFGLALACGGGTGNTTDGASASSTGSASASSTGSASATASTGSSSSAATDPTSGGGMSDSDGGTSTGAPGTSTGGSSSGGPASSSGGDTSSSSGGASSSSGGDSSSTGGPVCGGELATCAKGEACCPGLDCCAGVPVPQGEEFCSIMCPKSDRNLKTEFAAIDAAEVLRKVVALPITSWRYRKDEPVVRHIGPMAQDFHAAFGLWNSDTMIFPLDGSGVAMAAIQGLHARLVAAEEENAALRARLDRLERRLGE